MKKVSGSTTTVYIFSGTKVIAEYVNGAAPTAPTREYIYSGGALLAKIESGATKYYHPDYLSNRVVTDSSGSAVAQLGHYPFGESWYNVSNDKLRFTSYERDSESGNDYAMMRYGVNRLARFSSPDPISGSSTNPQSLNRYAYVRNDALNLIDPIGLQQTKLSFPPLTRYEGYDAFSLLDIPVIANPEWVYLDVSPWGVFNMSTGQSLAQMGWEQDLQGIFEVGTFLGWASDYFSYLPNLSSSNDTADQGAGGSGSTLDDRANALAHALKATDVQSLGNPCTVGGGFVVSAGVAAFGAAAIPGTEASAAVNEALAPQLPLIRYLASQPLVNRAAMFVVKIFGEGADAVQSGCNALQQ